MVQTPFWPLLAANCELSKQIDVQVFHEKMRKLCIFDAFWVMFTAKLFLVSNQLIRQANLSKMQRVYHAQ